MTDPQHPAACTPAPPTDREALREAIARAMYDAIDPNSGDPIAVTLHCSDHGFYEGDIAHQLEQVMATCRAAADAILPLVDTRAVDVDPGPAHPHPHYRAVQEALFTGPPPMTDPRIEELAKGLTYGIR